MKKETIIAIILGVGTGIVIAVAILFATGRGTLQPKKIIAGNITPTISIGSETIKPLTITTPQDKSTTDKATAHIKGSAEKNSLIVAHSAKSEVTLNTEENSQFDFDFPLFPGENIIKITSYRGTAIDSQTLTIYYFENES